MKLSIKHKTIIGLIFTFILALSLRLYGLNWDQGNHLHPDERFLTMLETTIHLPATISDYLNPAISPLNPYNYKEYQFYVYGTFPLFLVRYLAQIFHQTGYDQIYLVGRVLSALFDSLNIITLFFLSCLVTKKHTLRNLLPGIAYAFCVLPLQLSHFFAVDTYLSFFLLLTFALLAYKRFYLAAISFGLAMACKISALYFAPIIGLFVIYNFYKTKNTLHVLRITFYLLLFSFLTFRFFQPYSFVGLFNINPHFIENIKTLESYSDPNGWFPPAIQWMSKTAILFPLQNIILWGLGLPLSILFLFSLKSSKGYIFYTSILWIVLLITAQGIQFAHTMRYFLPVYPFVCLILIYLKSNRFLKSLIFLHLLVGVSFLSIYSRPHSRVDASYWIYQNIPSGSKITYEYWDDPLPLNLPQRSASIYQGLQLSPYDPDSPSKIKTLSSTLAQANYVIMSSNRLWGSIPQVPQKYPETTKYYQSLFDETAAFKKIFEHNSYPGISVPFMSKCYYFGPTNYPYLFKSNSFLTIDSTCLHPGVYFRDDIAEEAFTVYDHPKILIYKNEKI